jgi:hypothetical protein
VIVCCDCCSRYAIDHKAQGPAEISVVWNIKGLFQCADSNRAEKDDVLFRHLRYSGLNLWELVSERRQADDLMQPGEHGAGFTVAVEVSPNPCPVLLQASYLFSRELLLCSRDRKLLSHLIESCRIRNAHLPKNRETGFHALRPPHRFQIVWMSFTFSSLAWGGGGNASEARRSGRATNLTQRAIEASSAKSLRVGTGPAPNDLTSWTRDFGEQP